MNYDGHTAFLIASAMLLAAPSALCQASGTAGNNVLGDAIEVKFDQPFQESISRAGETDYYKFQIDTSGIATIKVDGAPDEMVSVIRLFNKNGEDKGSIPASNPGDSATLEKDILGPGWYYVQISDSAGKAHSGPYSLTVSFKPAPDQYEPNDSIGAATKIEPGQKLSAYICPVGDSDYYTFYSNASGIARVKVSDAPDEMSGYVRLFNKNGEDKGTIVASNPGDPVTFEKDILGPGWYYVQIYDNAGKAYSNPYGFELQFDPAPDMYEPNEGFGDARGIELGQAISGYICPSTDVDYYKVNMTGPGVLVVKVQDAPGEMVPEVALWNMNGESLGSQAATNAGDSVILEKGVSDTGTYYIRVDDRAGKAYSEPYTLTAALKGE
jgi:hypothetical protein